MTYLGSNKAKLCKHCTHLYKYILSFRTALTNKSKLRFVQDTNKVRSMVCDATIVCASKTMLSGEVFKESFTDILQTDLDQVAFSLRSEKERGRRILPRKKNDTHNRALQALQSSAYNYKCKARARQTLHELCTTTSSIFLAIKIGDYLSSGDRIGNRSFHKKDAFLTPGLKGGSSTRSLVRYPLSTFDGGNGTQAHGFELQDQTDTNRITSLGENNRYKALHTKLVKGLCRADKACKAPDLQSGALYAELCKPCRPCKTLQGPLLPDKPCTSFARRSILQSSANNYKACVNKAEFCKHKLCKPSLFRARKEKPDQNSIKLQNRKSTAFLCALKKQRSFSNKYKSCTKLLTKQSFVRSFATRFVFVRLTKLSFVCHLPLTKLRFVRAKICKKLCKYTQNSLKSFYSHSCFKCNAYKAAFCNRFALQKLGTCAKASRIKKEETRSLKSKERPIILNMSGRVVAISKTQLSIQKTQPILFYSSANLHVKRGNWVKEGSPVVTLTHQTLITGDIVQGIPRIEQLFEAFTSPPPAFKDKRGVARFKDVHDTLHSQLRDIFRKHWLKNVLPIAVRKSLEDIGYTLLEMIQKVYLSQGVLIADKHIEIIVRQIASKGQILDSGTTGLFLEETLPIRQIENANLTTPGKKCLYVPAVMGLTASALNSDSFISAASFQETTRVLSRDAVVGKSDFLRGLKEKVVIGDLISAGTGLDIYFIYTTMLALTSAKR